MKAGKTFKKMKYIITNLAALETFKVELETDKGLGFMNLSILSSNQLICSALKYTSWSSNPRFKMIMLLNPILNAQIVLQYVPTQSMYERAF